MVDCKQRFVCGKSQPFGCVDADEEAAERALAHR
jgi:hypothetical protein